MRQRSQRKKRRIAQVTISKGGEPPDPVTTGLVISGLTLAAGATTGIMGAVQNSKANKAAAAAAKAGAPKSYTVQQAADPALVAGESTTLKPGQKVNAINTSPQGLLEDATTGRRTLLGG